MDNDTVTLTVDGREVTVPKGTTLLEAAAAAGTKVPHYCYHPGLSSPAMCRLCLVEVEGAPKLQPSCVTQAQDGQVVNTESEQARQMRTGVLEFYLVNHPLDCPICDMSGECELQDYVYAEGRPHGRSREPKRVFGRDDFGGDVFFYGDRCVMCTRCVRFMNEVAEDERLTVVERGNRSVIDTFFERGLEGSPYSGNIVDICPVGALVSKDFLYKQRAWDLDHTPSICPNCSQGCNIELHTRDNLIQRLKPRENMAVNAFWMCDYGRSEYEWINRGDRLEVPLVRNDSGKLIATGWEEALSALVHRLDGDGADAPTAVVGSPFASNEDLASLLAFLQGCGGGEAVFRSEKAEEEVPLPGFPTLTRRRDLAPNMNGAELLGLKRVGDDDGAGGLEGVMSHKGVLIVHGDGLADAPGDFGVDASTFIYLGTHSSEAAAKYADFILPVTTFAEQEGTFTNVQGRVQRFWPGLQAPGTARPAWLILGALAAHRTGTEAPATAAQAFEALVQRAEAFQGIDFTTLGTRGAPVNETVSLLGEGT